MELNPLSPAPESTGLTPATATHAPADAASLTSNHLGDPMAEHPQLPQLKTWREKVGVSQQRFARIAGVSLAAFRRIEMEGRKPRPATLKRLLDAIKRVEANPGLIAEMDGRRQRALQARAAKLAAQVALKPAPKPALKVAAEPAPRPAPKPAPRPPAPQPKVEEEFPVRLTNLDLELINRVLNMSNREKLELLRQLIG